MKSMNILFKIKIIKKKMQLLNFVSSSEIIKLNYYSIYI